jgi:hypothetical protein
MCQISTNVGYATQRTGRTQHVVSTTEFLSERDEKHQRQGLRFRLRVALLGQFLTGKHESHNFFDIVDF